MRGVDLERFPFDTDLTFAALWMNADGTIYHRYGSRDVRGADQWLSVASLEAAMKASLLDHLELQPDATAPKSPEPLVMEAIPSFAKRDKGACIHCHSVRPALYEEQLAAGTWEDSKAWRFPGPSRLGLDFDRDRQRQVVQVRKDSVAERAGLGAGDLILKIGEQRIATVSDVMFALDGFPTEGGVLPIAFERGGEAQAAQLMLERGWKEASPLDFSWRPFKWGLTPAPGFGGPQLGRDDLIELGLMHAEDQGTPPFAFRIDYLVTWGDNKRFGRAAANAGLREGDVVIGVRKKGGQAANLKSTDHFHSWWRLKRAAGETVEVEILREAKPKTIKLDIIE
jgi:serine protease Do